jgi:hypothetical protein
LSSKGREDEVRIPITGLLEPVRAISPGSPDERKAKP